MIEYENGAQLDVKTGSYAEAEELLSAYLEAIQGSPLVFDDPDAFKLSVKGLISKAFISARMKKAVWACAARSLYRKAGSEGPPAQKVTPALFEDVKDRENLVEVLYDVAEANLSPFSKGLYAVSGRLSKTIESTQTSTS
jgi:hypothetical protein